MRYWRLRTISVAVGLAFFGCRGDSLDQITRKVRLDFPDVAQLTTAELAAWLDDPGRPAPLILDVRAAEEVAISHLPNARQVTPRAPIDDELLAADRATPIVAYCSVGYRSSRFVERLRAAGFTQVYNLEGSIFAWANEGRLVVRGERPVTEVHPYNRVWGRLLDSELHPRAEPNGGWSPAPSEGS